MDCNRWKRVFVDLKEEFRAHLQRGYEMFFGKNAFLRWFTSFLWVTKLWLSSHESYPWRNLQVNRYGWLTVDSDFESLELETSLESFWYSSGYYSRYVILMEKIKKLLKIGKIYRIEHETELRNRNYSQRKKDSKNQADWLKSFLIENPGLKIVRFFLFVS